uniref:Uncharacterized protein n=1 Tax=Zea mays TaxID=4577 RepID=A0A804LFI9_MAIZE
MVAETAAIGGRPSLQPSQARKSAALSVAASPASSAHRCQSRRFAVGDRPPHALRCCVCGHCIDRVVPLLGNPDISKNKGDNERRC